MSVSDSFYVSLTGIVYSMWQAPF